MILIELGLTFQWPLREMNRRELDRKLNEVPAPRLVTVALLNGSLVRWFYAILVAIACFCT